MSKNILKKKRISIREYQPEDQERVTNLLNAPSIKPEIWEWQFDNRHFKSSIKPIVAEDRWGNILGFNGMMPVKLHTKDHGELEAAWSCDFFVSRHCRGLGVGKEIKRELKAQSDLTFALGTSTTAAIVLEQSGWIPYSGVYAYSGNPVKLDHALPKNHFDSDTLPDSAALDQLWRDCKHNFNAAVIRDSQYIEWRYQASPVAKYRYIYGHNEGQLEYLAVYFESESQITLVDYLGPNDGSILQSILQALAQKRPYFKCTTSSKAWEQQFIHAGLSKSEKPSNCFIYSEDPRVSGTICKGLYVMPGDCDGDFLGSSVAQARIQDGHKKYNYKVNQITFEQFLTMEVQWNELVANSDNSNLFGSWSWIKLWWEHFSACNKFEFKLITCTLNGKLVGASPLYLRRYTRYQILTVRQLQLIGCSWSGPNTFRSEYLDILARNEHARAARLAMLDHIFDHLHWDELVFGDILHQSLTTRLIEECYGSRGLYPRTVHEDHSVIVNCEQSQEAYIANLSSNFRRATILKQDKLVANSEYQFEVYAQGSDCPVNIIDTLNTLHLPRWGKPCFEGQHKAFHEALIDQFSKDNALNIATTSLDGKLVAITYNLVFEKSVYNIQLGYDDSAAPSYSLGLMHLMQNVTGCIKDHKLKEFDLLAGYGKREFYKERFGGHIQNVLTKQYLRGRWVKLMYKIYDKWQKYKRFTKSKKHG